MRVFSGLRGHRTQSLNAVGLIRRYKAYLLQQKVASFFVKSCSDCHLCLLSVTIPFTQNFLKGFLEM